MTNEQWMPIVGYEGLYEISSKGKVARIDNGFRLLKQHLDRKGYPKVTLSKSGILHTARVHRLVAEHFIPNSCGFTEVNHRDEDKTNNSLSNLEWCTREYNVNFGTRTERQIAGVSKPVIGHSPAKTLSFKSGSEAAKVLGMSSPSGIFACCKGQRKTAGGFRWRYVNE